MNCLGYIDRESSISSQSSSLDLSKSKKEHVTIYQKESMVEFVIENPELVTHSSTKENENWLWQQLTRKLNDLKPEKSVDSWKQFWKRWVKSLSEKPESKLLSVESKLKNFLNKILPEPNNEEKFFGRKKLMKVSEIQKSILEMEKEKYKLNLEIDDNEVKIHRYRNMLKSLELQNSQKRKRVSKINEKRTYYLMKKKKYEDSRKRDIKNQTKEEEWKDQDSEEHTNA